MLSYLSLYLGHRTLDFKSFKILFQNEEGIGTAGWDEARFLDLTSLLNEHFMISDVGRCLRWPIANGVPDMGNLHISNVKSGKVTENVPVEVVESWEEEVDEVTTQPVLAATLHVPHFSNLSRLSLAHPGEWASWPELARISPHLHKITHLSLAHWPRPSMTPNATTTSMVSNHTSVSLGGSHFYSDLDDDWHEATNILRRFSVNTYSLQWLDLEGCNWLRALTWQAGQSTAARLPVAGEDSEAWDINTALPGPDWNDAWRRITYLNVFQGWIPSDNQSLQNMPAGIVPVQLMRWLRENKDKEDVRWRLNANESGQAVGEWMGREKVARVVAAEIQAARKRAEGVWCRVEFGWGGNAGEKAS